MSFMDAKFSKWGEVATAVLSQSLAKRFARVMLAAVLAASFLPVAAFADTGGDSELKRIKGKDSICWYEIASYENTTERSDYLWTVETTSGGGEIRITQGERERRVSVEATGIGSVTLTVSGGDKPSESITIEIRKRTVDLSSSYGEKIYDGTPLTVIGINEDGEGWISADRDRVKYTMTGSQTNAGESDNTFDVEFPSGSEEYFKKHYDITISYGTLNVAQRPVTLTSASGSKEYDGKPLTNHEVTVGEPTWDTGWVDGQGATYDVTGSQTIVGSSENTFECIPNEGTNLDNYQINKTYGTLTVTGQFAVGINDAKLTIIGGDSDKSASNLPHTGDSAALYLTGICGVAIAAGAVAFVARRKSSSRR